MKLTTMIVLAFLCLCGTKERYQIPDKLLGAIETVESGGKGDSTPDGDGGKAIGPFQIRKEYFADAAEYDKSLDDYQKCKGVEFSRKVVRAYMARYANKNASNEDVARIHNGGCNILKKKGSKAWDNTTKYWEKVKKELDKIK